MKNSFSLIGASGKNYGYADNPNRLKDTFLQSGESAAVVQMNFVSNPPTLNVTPQTSNAEWNEYYNKYGRVRQND